MICRYVRGAALTVGSAWLQQLQSCTFTHTHRRKAWVNRTPLPSPLGEQDQPSAVGRSAGPGLTHAHTVHTHTCHIQLSSIPYTLPYPPTSVYTCPLLFYHTASSLPLSATFCHPVQCVKPQRTSVMDVCALQMDLGNLDSPRPHQSS